MEQATIRVLDIYPFHRKIAVGLDIRSSGRFPLIVGCSVRSDDARIIDIPSRVLGSEGIAIWEMEAPDECGRCDAGNSRPYEWGGEVLFALWPDNAYTNRLADTGWVKWAAPWMVGHSQAGAIHQEGEIQRKYGPRKDAWA